MKTKDNSSIFAKLILTIFIFYPLILKSQDLQVVRIYKKGGQPVSYSQFVEEVATYDVVLFGERHNCPVTHWLQKMLLHSLYDIHGNNLVLGAEMFETDNQLILQEYLNGIITEERFEKEARLWQNYSTDYQSLVEFAKDKSIQFFATNIPRRYARIVTTSGLEGLDSLVSIEAKKYIAPLPISYEADSTLISFFAMMGSHMEGGQQQKDPYFMAQAQAIKDATMANNIVRFATKSSCLLHFNGNYHSDLDSGIPTYIRKYNPKLNYATISSVRQDNIDEIAGENKEKADFIIVVKRDFPYSY